MKPLDGKVALVTGAASAQGIGFASARSLARAGARVVITDLVRDATAQEILEQRCDELRSEGLKASACALDVTSAEAARAATEHAIAQFGRIDVAFNNAGYPGGAGPFEAIDASAWQRSWDINVMGAVHVTQALLPVLREQGDGGAIINNASLAGLGAIADMAAYSTSKFAVVGLTKALATELAADGIRVNAVCPGMVMTDMGRQEIDVFRRDGESLEAAQKRLAADVPLGQRWASPDEIGEAVAFLAGPAASYINGVALPVSGGLAPGL